MRFGIGSEWRPVQYGWLVPIDPNDPGFLKERTLPRHPPPEALTRPLLPYHEEGLGWMLKQELDEDCGGGILADEMGMGKTIQTISTIVAAKELAAAADGEAGLWPAGPTLVICPSSVSV